MSFTWFVVTTVTRRLKRYSQNVLTFAVALSIKTVTNGMRNNTHWTEKGKARQVRKGFLVARPLVEGGFHILP